MMAKRRTLSLEGELNAIRAQSDQPEEMQELDLYTIGALAEEDYQKQKREMN